MQQQNKVFFRRTVSKQVLYLRVLKFLFDTQENTINILKSGLGSQVGGHLNRSIQFIEARVEAGWYKLYR